MKGEKLLMCPRGMKFLLSRAERWSKLREAAEARAFILISRRHSSHIAHSNVSLN